MKELFSKKKVMEVDLDVLRSMSLRLARDIERQGFTPGHILYIERAGLLVGFEMAAYFGCGISGIHSKRYGGSAKSLLKPVLKRLPRFLTHLLRKLELKSNIHNVKSERQVYCEQDMPPDDKSILLVDDALDTGHSLVAVIDYLKGRGYNPDNIKTAVLTVTGENQVVRPDFNLLEGVTCAFPWSYDSRQYDETRGVYNTQKYVIGFAPFLNSGNREAGTENKLRITGQEHVWDQEPQV